MIVNNNSDRGIIATVLMWVGVVVDFRLNVTKSSPGLSHYIIICSRCVTDNVLERLVRIYLFAKFNDHVAREEEAKRPARQDPTRPL